MSDDARLVTPELVSMVLAAAEGTTLIWAIAPRGEIRDRIFDAVQVALGPSAAPKRE